MSETELIQTDQSRLLEKLAAGDDATLSLIYRKYFKSVLHLVNNNNGSDDDAKDVYQDTICVLYDAVRKPGFDLTCSLQTYIYSIARNLWLKELRRRSGSETRIKESDEQRSVDTDNETKDFFQREDELEKMKVSLQELGNPCQTILTDFFFHKLSMEDIAYKMGYTNADNAKNQKYKCFIRLKKIMMAKIKR